MMAASSHFPHAPQDSASSIINRSPHPINHTHTTSSLLSNPTPLNNTEQTTNGPSTLAK